MTLYPEFHFSSAQTPSRNKKQTDENVEISLSRNGTTNENGALEVTVVTAGGIVYLRQIMYVTHGCTDMKPIIVVVLIVLLITPAYGKDEKPRYQVESAGGSLSVRAGERIGMTISSERISFYTIKEVEDDWVLHATHKQVTLLAEVPVKAVTGLSYASDTHHRIGKGVAVGFISLGAGLIVAATKEKKHYIGMTWNDSGNKGGVALRVDKKQYRGIILAFEAVTGQKCVNEDITISKKLGIE